MKIKTSEDQYYAQLKPNINPLKPPRSGVQADQLLKRVQYISNKYQDLNLDTKGQHLQKLTSYSLQGKQLKISDDSPDNRNHENSFVQQQIRKFFQRNLSNKSQLNEKQKTCYIEDLDNFLLVKRERIVSQDVQKKEKENKEQLSQLSLHINQFDNKSVKTQQSQDSQRVKVQLKSRQASKESHEEEEPVIKTKRSASCKPNKVLADITNVIGNQTKYQYLGRFEEGPPIVSARCWALYDADTCKIIDGKSQYNVREIASLTKIMTFYTVLKLFERLGIDMEKVTFRVTQFSCSPSGTTANLREGMWIKLIDLFYAMMLPSGNDASLVLAENCGVILQLKNENISKIVYDKDLLYKRLLNSKNTVFNFIQEMNKNVKLQTLCQSIYSNPHGLMNKDNKSTANDVAKISCIAMQEELFRTVVRTHKYQCIVYFDNGNNEFIEWENTNKLLGRKGYTGLKTGITDAAGPCLCSSFSLIDKDRGINKNFVLVLLNSKSMDIRWEESEKLINWAISNPPKNIKD